MSILADKWSYSLRFIRAKRTRLIDSYGINAALAERKANRPALKAQARSDAAKLGWETRRRAGA